MNLDALAKRGAPLPEGPLDTPRSANAAAIQRETLGLELLRDAVEELHRLTLLGMGATANQICGVSELLSAALTLLLEPETGGPARALTSDPLSHLHKKERQT